MNDIINEMTLADAAKIAREMAATLTGYERAALTMLADSIYAESPDPDSAGEVARSVIAQQGNAAAMRDCGTEKPMTLDEAIDHAEEVAGDGDTPCRREHRQLAEWLKELRELKQGNAAALREALVCLRDAARNFYNQILNSKYSVIMDKYTCCKQGFPAVLDLRYAIPKANFAISKPPRNCDVGTPEEQAERFWGYCNAHSCNECPARGGWRTVYVDGASCKLIQCGVLWAQMPYEAQEGGAA